LYFLELFSKKNKRDIKGFSPDAMGAMIRYDWEGNVRELMNCVERGVVLTRSDYIGTDDLSFVSAKKIEDRQAQDESGPMSLARIEETAILSTLESSRGNKSETARKLGITRKTLLKKLKQYGSS
jgi:two-component system response regulator HydG